MELDELCYIRIQTKKLPEWKTFAAQVLGAMAIDGPNGSLRLKIDEWAYRVVIIPGDAERFLVSGWSVRDANAYETAIAHVSSCGVEIYRGTPEECAERLVVAFFRITDPAANVHEVCWGRSLDSRAFLPSVPVSGFVTGNLGLGHVVLPCRGDYDAALKFYHDVMGLEFSDFFSRELLDGRPPMRVHFHHCKNGRQHSLAIGEFGSDTGLNHFLLEVKTLDDVGRALDRCVENGTEIARSLGKHVNDSMVSFYLVSPSGFSIEYGYGGQIMDWTNHVVTQIEVGSHWGHAWKTKPSASLKVLSTTEGRAAKS